MSARALWITAAAFVLGFASAWVAKPAESSAAGASVPPARVTRAPRVRPASKPADGRAQEMLRKFADAKDDPAKQAATLSEAADGDFPAMIRELAQRAGLTGMEYADQDLLEKLVIGWYSKDPDGALDWVLALQKPKDRKNFLLKVIDTVAKRDIAKAAELLRRHGREDDGGWLIPYQFANEVGKLDASRMVETLGQFISSDGSSSGMEVTFSENFDFRRALDGLADIKAGLGKGEKIAITLTNLLSEWTERDPAAAWEWIQQGRNLSNDDVAGFLKGYRENATTGELAGKLVEAMSLKFEPQEPFRMAWDVMAEKPDAGLIGQFLEQAPGDRNENLRQLFGMAEYYSGGRYDKFKVLLLGQMTAAERFAVVGGQFGKSGMSQSDRNFYTPVLRRLGHTDEEIGRMLP